MARQRMDISNSRTVQDIKARIGKIEGFIKRVEEMA
jgi:hypothetical protein